MSKDIKNIVVGIDFSTHSANALNRAADIAQSCDANLHVLHVIDVRYYYDFMAIIPLPHEDLQRKAEKKMEEFMEKCRKIHAWVFEASVDVRLGLPLDEIKNKVEEVGADLLILGTSGEGPSEGRVGAVATKCVRKIPTEVMLVQDTLPKPMKKVMACVDFSNNSPHVIEKAFEIASGEGAELHVVHIFNAPWHVVYYDTPDVIANIEIKEKHLGMLKEKMNRLVNYIEGGKEKITLTQELIENPHHGAGIEKYVQDNGIDLVVMGVHGRSNLAYVMLGSTAEHVIKDANCSILTVRA